MHKIVLTLFFFFFVGTLRGQIDFSNSRHEIRLGVGSPSVATPFHSPLWQTDSYYYQGKLQTIPSMYVQYSYHLNSWLSIGGGLLYIGIFQNTYDLFSGNIFFKRNQSYIGATPHIRFDWYRNSLLSLYSSMDIGLGMLFERSDYLFSHEEVTRDELICTLDLTPIGVRLGGDFFVFAEMGIGISGLLKAGFGYCF